MSTRKMLSLAVFPQRKLAFDPERDNQDVDQFGFIHLSESFEKGILPGGIDMTEDSFNGVENPGTLIPRSDDVFCGLRKAQYVQSMLQKLSAEQREKAEKALQQNAEKVTHEASSEG